MVEAVGVLGDIVRAKRAELDQRFRHVALDALRDSAMPTRVSLEATIAAPGARFILEVKRASPSLGSISACADVGEIVRGYAPVADAISVLTERRFFGGSPADLAAARAAFSGPILAKDFFLDPRQVVEARLVGADAILVMLSAVDDLTALTLMAEAKRFAMDVLVEVHDEAEMRRALTLGASLIGINNRDLRDLSIDLATTERLAPHARDRLLISESGIRSRHDVDRLTGKVDGFLVGSALMGASRPAEAARELVFGRVKLCGLTRREDVDAGGAGTYAGLVFVADSPRFLSMGQAAPVAGRARRCGMLPVGVFRDAPIVEVAETAALLNLHAVQLHGREDFEYVRSLRRELGRDCEIWTASSVGRDRLVGRGGDRIVFDQGNGGSGRCFDWDLVRNHGSLRRSLIAGGIGAANARGARALGAHAIDVSSSIEALPGIKSRARIAELFEALRPQCRRRPRQCA